MPLIRSSLFKSIVPDSPVLAKHVYTATVIISLSKVMLLCSRYIEKGLEYIAIAALFSHQPSSYTKYIKSNMQLSCNI